MKLIPEWRQAWRMLSVQVASLAIVWGALPVDQQRPSWPCLASGLSVCRCSSAWP